MHGEEVMENNYQLSRIHNYVTGLMSEEEMYQIERDALADPFLQDAIDGYKLQRGVDSKPLSILQQRLARRLQEQSEDRSRRFYSWQRLAIGTAAGVLFLVVCSLIFFNQLNPSDTIRNNEVLLMEQTLRVHTRVAEDADAVPEQGWNQFNEELNSELRGVHHNGILEVQFVIVNGLAKEVQVSAPAGGSEEDLRLLVKDFIEQKIRWQGNNGHLTVRVDP